MKNRIVALLLILALTAGIAMTAYAKPSPEGGEIKIYGPNGEEVLIIKIDEDKVTGSLICDHGDLCEGVMEIVTPALSKYREIVDALNLDELLDNTEFEGKEWMKMFEMELIAKDCVDFPITISFDKKDWAEGQPLVVHYIEEKEEWEIVEVKEEGDVYLAEFNSVSPVVFYQVNDVVDTIAPVEDNGNNQMFITVAAVGIIAIVGLVAMKKKKSV